MVGIIKRQAVYWPGGKILAEKERLEDDGGNGIFFPGDIMEYPRRSKDTVLRICREYF